MRNKNLYLHHSHWSTGSYYYSAFKINIMNKSFMNSIEEFKSFMSGETVPSYINHYCCMLDDEKWKRFYGQMKEPIKFAKSVENLFYVLKWILKQEFDDLSYAVFLQEVLDPEGTSELVDDSWYPVLFDRYWKRLDNDISEMQNDTQKTTDRVLHDLRRERDLYLNSCFRAEIQASSLNKRLKLLESVVYEYDITEEMIQQVQYDLDI